MWGQKCWLTGFSSVAIVRRHAWLGSWRKLRKYGLDWICKVAVLGRETSYRTVVVGLLYSPKSPMKFEVAFIESRDGICRAQTNRCFSVVRNLSSITPVHCSPAYYLLHRMFPVGPSFFTFKIWPFAAYWRVGIEMKSGYSSALDVA